MNWNTGYTASYYMTRVDPVTWRDTERIEITGGSIKREADGLRESASVDCVNYSQDIDQWVRIWLDTKQGNDSEHVPLFTGIATSPDDEYDGNLQNNTVDCYSVLKAVDDVGLLRGWYAPSGIDGAELVRQLLSATPAPVIYDGGAPRLENYIVAENGETHLTMIEKILLAIDWRLRISGDGSISIEPFSDEPVANFDPLENDIIETKIKVSSDTFNCPNVFVAIQDDLMAIARDDSDDSPLSTVNRGREVWMQEDGCELSEDQTIAEYALRRLKREQRVVKSASYDRRFLPNIVPTDVVRVNYPRQNLSGLFRIGSQSIDLSYAAQTSETIYTEE